MTRTNNTTNKINFFDAKILKNTSVNTFKKNLIGKKIININAKAIGFSNPQTSADLLENGGNVFIQKSQIFFFTKEVFH